VEVFYFEPGICFSWHHLLRRTLVLLKSCELLAAGHELFVFLEVHSLKPLAHKRSERRSPPAERDETSDTTGDELSKERKAGNKK
jgi:hypothetical protein